MGFQGTQGSHGRHRQPSGAQHAQDGGLSLAPGRQGFNRSSLFLLPSSKAAKVLSIASERAVRIHDSGLPAVKMLPSVPAFPVHGVEEAVRPFASLARFGDLPRSEEEVLDMAGSCGSSAIGTTGAALPTPGWLQGASMRKLPSRLATLYNLDFM